MAHRINVYICRTLLPPLLPVRAGVSGVSRQGRTCSARRSAAGGGTAGRARAGCRGWRGWRERDCGTAPRCSVGSLLHENMLHIAVPLVGRMANDKSIISRVCTHARGAAAWACAAP